MTDRSTTRVTELDFDTIKENLKTFLRGQSEFQDFDFDGAGMNILMELLAYNTHYNAFQLNMVGNEAFLDSAQLRASIISHAKLMNYVPGSKTGALARLDIKVTPSGTENQIVNVITLDKYTRLLGADVDGVNYPFVTLYSNTVAKESGSFDFSSVYVKQGEVISLQYEMTPENTKRRFEIPSANVDMSTVVIAVQDSAANTDIINYTLAEDITELTGNSAVYFVEENENLNYTFYFGDGVIGKKPQNGNIITCTYLDTVGSVSNNISAFVFVEPIADTFSDNIAISVANTSYGGTEKESVEQVRFRAPYFYSTQNRAVIDTDYETLLLKDYNNIDSVSVWGGEDNDPIIYGKVFISLKTKGNYSLTNFEKEQIKNQLIARRNVMTVTPEIVDPDYVYLLVRGHVTYNPSLTALSSGQLQELVSAAVQDYNDNELNRFASVFRKTKLQQYVENADKSITGSDLKIFVQKRFLVDTANRRSYTINFSTPVSEAALTNKLSSYPEIQIYDNNNVTRNAFIEEVPEPRSGIDNIVIEENGRNYLSTPTVTITGDGTEATATARIVSGRVVGIDITNPGKNYSYALVTITGGDGTGASATAKLQASLGVLRSFYYKTNGEKVVINNNVGEVDYTTGKIVLNNLRVFSVSENEVYDDDYLTLNVLARDSNIYPLRNRILTIDENDPRSVQVTMVAE